MNCIFCIIFRGSIYNLNFMFPKIMQNIAKHLFILFILSLGYISASAQNITLNSYSVKDGLSNSTVKAICQDDKGYIWIGTKNGLNRLDGYEIKNYYHLPSKEVKQPNDIVSITQLSDGSSGSVPSVESFSSTPCRKSLSIYRSGIQEKNFPRP